MGVDDGSIVDHSLANDTSVDKATRSKSASKWKPFMIGREQIKKKAKKSKSRSIFTEPESYPCGNGKNAHLNHLCDGNDDCGNGADEHKDCDKIDPYVCCDEEDQCKEGICCPYLRKCVPNSAHLCHMPAAECDPGCWYGPGSPELSNCKCENKCYPSGDKKNKWVLPTCKD